MDYDFLKKLIEKAEQYELDQQNNQPITIENFAEWLCSTKQNKRFVAQKEEKNIGELVGLMYRYAKNYSKKALKNTPMQTIEEFTYMATLMESPLMKMQIVDRHLQEKTTGMAIIQRLLKKGWVVESENKSDGRSQIVHLTDLGHNILRGGFLEMNKVARIVTADLTDDEKAELIRILTKLETFHRTVFDTEKTVDLDAVIEKYKL